MNETTLPSAEGRGLSDGLGAASGARIKFTFDCFNPRRAMRLEQEMGDVCGAILFVADEFNLDRAAINNRALEKLSTFRAWHADPDNGAEAFNATRSA